ncbi:MAG: hypothetical protein M3Y87_05240 [Myxococcota bacterium]|nr:hypothetical protein [Myxococcota bacterium]
MRAARVVTLGLAGAIASGCAASHTPPGEVADAGTRSADAAVPVDAHALADAGCPSFDFSDPPSDQSCCEAAGFWWDESSDGCIVLVPGPFVPPAMA